MKKRCILSIISLLLTLVLLLAQVTLLISCTNESESTDSGNGNCATDDTPDDSGSSGNSGNENGDDKPNGDENVTPGDELVLKKQPLCTQKTRLISKPTIPRENPYSTQTSARILKK